MGQGSSGAAVASQAMIDMGLREYFGGSADEIYYGSVRFEAAAFQDDIAKPSGDVLSCQAGMTKLAAMLGARGLEAHEEKTGYILYGAPAFKEKVEEELEVTPLTFGTFKVKRKDKDKYLGQVLHQDGLAMSVRATIEERTSKVKGAIYTVASLLETFELQAMGGLMAAKYLWEGAIVPSLLAGAGTWVGCTGREEEMCEELQMLFWRTILQVPKGTPKVMMRAETGSRRMKYRIWKQKVMLAKRIKSQKGSLANLIFEEQLKMGWGGLVKEVAEICMKLGVNDVSKMEVTKEELEERIGMADYVEMKEDMEKCSKLKDVKDGDFREVQKYMEWKGVEKGRLAFRIRSRMMMKVKANFKNGNRESLKCDNCQEEEDETQEHMMSCPGWRDELGSLDVLRLEDAVEFFTRVLRKKEA